MTAQPERVSEALKPCPFCGSDADFTNVAGGGVFIECQSCHGEGPMFERDRQAIAAWNRRAVAAPDALRAARHYINGTRDDSGNKRECLGKIDAALASPPATPPKPRFLETFCSQCGGKFGPGDSGYSHCVDHGESNPNSPAREKGEKA